MSNTLNSFFVGTAHEGSLRRWPTQGRRTLTVFPQDARMRHGTQLSATTGAQSGMTVPYAALASPRLYMLSTCDRKVLFYLVYMSRVPIRLIGTVAPALNYLTRFMDVQTTRSSCSRPSLVGTSLSTLSQTVGRPSSCAPGLTKHCPVSTRPTRHRYPLDSSAERPDQPGDSSSTSSIEARSTRRGLCTKCPRVLQALCLLLSGPRPAAGGALPPSHQAGPGTVTPAPVVI